MCSKRFAVPSRRTNCSSRPPNRSPSPTGRAASCRTPPANTTASHPADPALRSEALLDAGELYAQSNSRDRALDAYIRYVKELPKPVETAIETRLKIAERYKAAHDKRL